ncbi:hypothetical protein [Nocardioides xinjiangensis]|uniref:hypothetical protein n=1 Tax=Nocardioides xinjiangensis TaxID=2817376 RepID=UPI001B315B36|nr:hypothetical protein [Nocardioides sp. SYSU D00778]
MTSFLCLAYVLWRPVSNQAVLLAVLGVLAASSALIVMRTSPPRLSAHLGGMLFGILCLLSVGLLVGSFHGNPGLLHQCQLWVGMLVIWLPWTLAIQVERLRAMFEGIAVVIVALSTLIVYYVAAQRGLVPALLPASLLESQEAGFAETDGGSAIRLYGLSTLAAGGPLMAACMVARKNDLLPRRWLSVLAGVLVVVATLVAGRRAIAAVTLLSPVLMLQIQSVLRPGPRQLRIPPSLVVLAPGLVLAVVVVPAGVGLVARGWTAVRDGAALFLGLGSAVSTDKELDDRLRRTSADQLIAAWGEDPVFGRGLGAELATGFERNFERPWLFELQYHQFLFNFGLVGVLSAICLVLIAVGAVRTAARTHPGHVPVIAACTTAALCLLIANGSNPYLQTYGHGWGVALAAGVLNAMLTGSDEAASRSQSGMS